MKEKYQIGALKTKTINDQKMTNKLTKNVETFKLKKLSLMVPSTPRHCPIDIIDIYGNDLQRDFSTPFLVNLSLMRAF